jgi:uncharacterized protein (TIGR03083 family)
VSAPGTRRGTLAGLDHVELFAAAAERFALAVAGCDMRAAVPSCPGWSTYDLVCHLGNTHAWAATIVETGAFAVEQNDEPRSRKQRAVSEWYAGKAEDLYEVLRGADAEAPCWNFAFGAGEAGFWGRRQLHETTIHQVDLDLTADRGTHLDTEVCADGVDEALRVFLHRMHDRGYPAALAAPVCLVATDTDDAWTVSPRVSAARDAGVPVQVRGSTTESAPPIVTGPPLVADRRHPSADRVEAPADVLYRLLWKRCAVDDSAVRISGDRLRTRTFLTSRLVP